MKAPPSNSRLAETFRLLARHVKKMFSELPLAKIRLCPTADRDHKKTWRVFAHTMHKDNTICFAAAAEEDLTNEEMAGIMAHEFGHLIAFRLGWPGHNPRTPKWIQNQADKAVKTILKLPLRYNSRKLEELPASAIRRLIKE